MNNLRARLALIKKTNKKTISKDEEKTTTGEKNKNNNMEKNFPLWQSLSKYCISRKVYNEINTENLEYTSTNLKYVVKDFASLAGPVHISDLLFFDLETTGLSGGAGTVAFLAAFGRFLPDNKFETTQYLLLDYPGEYDFINAILNELNQAGKNQYIVTYNGKAFDAQLLKTRCLMNGIVPPDLLNVDLLYGARRLWKSLLPSCSQASIEEHVLGIPRSDDLPGAYAPEAWFNFLRTGANYNLLRICCHNVRDITGLAQIFLTIHKIALSPISVYGNINFDIERIAVIWYKTAMRNNCDTSFAYSLLEAAASKSTSSKKKALRVIAIINEWHTKDKQAALFFVKQALLLPDLSEPERADFEKRKMRLEKALIFFE